MLYLEDMWRYISDGWFIQPPKAGEVGSSTMPQKVNPIQFENSEGNIKVVNGTINGIIDALAVSRLQRDLSGSTAMRYICPALTECLVIYKSCASGLERCQPDLNAILGSLNANWSILTEGVQTVLRRQGVEDPYSIVADLSRGREITQNEWQDFIRRLPSYALLDEAERGMLLALSPETYLGEAQRLTEMAVAKILAA